MQTLRGDGHLQELIYQGPVGSGGNLRHKRRNRPEACCAVEPRGNVTEAEIHPGEEHLVDRQ
jgi:hypothetical protein